ncbi:hypothetical protein OCU04_002693 [Sclerotinia nivalis]|uniref:Aminoglycoside phosphotransferase domain-containing protein n=1 Tax=Sclerotinia nivalis TaxID=352851 RepID=A0A9X0DPC5_9HELO|nr:hypothetical protein OCU04_002693 [Sclerotinia nivalis]
MEGENTQKIRRDVITDKLEFNTTYHPGVDTKDLIHDVHGTIISKLSAPPHLHYGSRDTFILCRNCGLTNHEAATGYTSRIKLKYVRFNSAIWELGGPDGPWLLRDELNIPDYHMTKDYTTQKFLREAKSGVPLVEMHRFGGKDEKFNFTMMSRAKGKSVDDLWSDGILCDEQLDDIFLGLEEHFKRVRQFTSPYMQRVDGGELLDCHIGNCNGFGCVKTGRNEEEWLENLTPGMRKGLLYGRWVRNKAGLQDPAVRGAWVKDVDEQIVKLKANFPKGGPYVLTHGDLNWSNIFVSNDNAERKWKITAVIDWETAGYFPWWVELLSSGLLDKEEKALSRFCPPTFEKKDWKPMVKAIKDVQKIWESGGSISVSKHGMDGANHWFGGKEFCECHKIRQHFVEWDMGWPQEHQDVFDPGLTDSGDDSDQDRDRHKHDKHERKFLRWFNEIST